MDNSYYSDINLNFSPHPMTGDITLNTNDVAVKRAMHHIIMLKPFDIPFQPDLHGYVHELLFEIPSDTTRLELASRIKWVINKLEPRAIVHDVKVVMNDDETQYYITIVFSIDSLLERYTTGFYLERVR